ncbi:lamin tail domain-containing protein [Demequina sp. NBRC 110054]|uniref:lamin tail domain-containing protein n=1 Tax=Demequina sp. NBRC 110054 TaxID=1570343 RepID=UPI0009FCCB1A|nr:lamin tail domain-containing protein [Demequina sp. NBRC 110054]
MRMGRIAAATAAAAMGLGGTLVALPAAADVALPTVAINEVDSKGDPEDWVELYNYGAEDVDLSGMYLRDDKDDDEDHLQFAEGTTLAAGAYLLLDKDDFLFGIGSDDTIRLFATDDETLVDSYALTGNPDDTANAWGRCPDGTGDWAELPETPGTANSCDEEAATVEDSLVINEIESDGDDSVLAGEDWIELINTSDEDLDVNGVIVMDGKTEDAEEDAFTITGLEPIPAGGFVVLTKYDDDTETGDFDFGLGKGDTVQLFSAGTALAEIASGAATPFETWTWPEGNHAAVTYGRCPDGTGEFHDTVSPTPGTANDCDGATLVEASGEPDDYSGDLAINEVESNGDDTDWVEVINLTGSPIDISGWSIKDNDDSRTDVVPDGTVVPAYGIVVIDQQSATYPEGFDFGLGDGDTFRLYDLSGELAAKATWDAHASVTWGRCPDGTGDWTDTTVSTQGEPNDCSVPIRVNEVESSDDADGPDWVELTNIGSTTVDLAGLVLTDDDTADHRYTFTEGSLAPGEFLVVDKDTFDFGLGGGDEVHLFDTDGTTELDSYAWTEHAATTYGRCPDGTGEFETTLAPTPGDQNSCEGIVNSSPWPGGEDVSVLDGADDFTGDMSGIDYAASGTDEPGTLWAVQNGDGLLYHLAVDGAILDQWTLRYGDGTGVVDAEGVTVTDEEDVVYVSTERNNDASSVSRPSVLRYDVTGSGTLSATDEWNLASLLPTLSANGGLEGVTWIPDAWLVDEGFVDESTGLAYDPADYADHGNGLFVVGVETTAAAYVVALMDDGSSVLIATISTESVSFDLVADVQFSGAGALWVVCDEACDGRIALYTIEDGAFTVQALYDNPAGMDDGIANEGFAIGDSTVCVDGSVPTYYADDADTDDYSLRTGTLPCVGNVGTALDSADVSDDDGTEDGSDDGASDDGSGDGSEGESGTAGSGSGISAPSSATQGETITIQVGDDDEYAGEEVSAEIHSDVVDLGTLTVAADGTIQVTIPSDIAVGTHTLYVYDAEGELIGSADITITSAALAATGGDATGLALGALLALAGVGVLIARRRLPLAG